jgi:hypothetical protein
MSELHLLPDSPDRMVSSPEHQEKLRTIWQEIEERHREELMSAGVLRCWSIRRKMNAEYRREAAKISPSQYAV